MRMRLAVPVLGLVLMAACGSQEAADPADTLDESNVAATAPAADAPNDAQIAAIVLTANSADSTAGVLGESKATSPQVKEFARRMVADHGAVNQMAVELATRLGVTPEQSPTSQALLEDGEQNILNLQSVSGEDFDKAYIDHEVALHQQVLDALDQTLLPSAQNAELRSLLEEGRPIFEAHLEMAKQIQTSPAGP